MAVSVKEVIANGRVTSVSRSSNVFNVRNPRTFLERLYIAILFRHAFLASLFLFFMTVTCFKWFPITVSLMKIKTAKCIIKK